MTDKQTPGGPTSGRVHPHDRGGSVIERPATAALEWPRRFAAYSAGELAEISGLSPDMQRLWRQRGHLPKVGSGHARFSPTEVIEVSIRYALSRRGIPPSETPEIDPAAVRGALYHTIISHQGSCEVIGPPDDVDNFLEDYELQDFAFAIAGEPTRSNYLVWDDAEASRVVDDLNEFFDEQAVAIVAIDLTVVGARIMERGRKPVVTLEAPAVPGQRRVRRLNGIGSNDS